MGFLEINSILKGYQVGDLNIARKQYYGIVCQKMSLEM